MIMGKTINLNSIKKFFSPAQYDLDTNIKENPKSTVYKLAIPTLISLLFLNINGLMDNMWISGLGTDSLAGVGFILSIFTVIIGIGSGLGISTTTTLSPAIADKNHSLVDKITINSLIATLITGVIISLMLVIFLKPMLNILNVKTALGSALDYGYILFGGMLVFFFASVVPAILKARGDLKKITYTMVSTSFLNMILDPILIYKLNLGVKGAAIATVFCSFICCIMLSYFTFKNNEKRDLKSSLKIDLSIIKDLIFLAIPIISESFVLSIIGLIFTILFNTFGTTVDVAIFTIIFKIYCLAVIPIIAISDSAVIISAYLSTSYKLNELKNIIKYMMKIGIIFSLIIWIIIIFLNDIIAELFLAVHTDILFKTLLANNMKLMLFIIIPLTIGLISTSVLKGLKLGKISFVLSVTRSLILEVIFSLIFILVFHLGTIGIYYGMITGTMIGSLICLIVSISCTDKFFKKLES